MNHDGNVNHTFSTDLTESFSLLPVIMLNRDKINSLDKPMSNRSLKIYKSIRAAASPVLAFSDQSGWTGRLGYSLHEGLRRALSQVESDQSRIDLVLQLTQNYVAYVAATNDLYVGEKDGFNVAISYRKNSNPGSKGEARVGVRTPENRIVFVTVAGDKSKRFQGFNDPYHGFNHWWWKKESRQWVERANSAPETDAIGNVRQFYNGNPRVILPSEFWDHIAKTPATIIELLADAITRAYYANRNDSRMAFRNFQKTKRKLFRKKIQYALMETLQEEFQRGLERQLEDWLGDVQLNSSGAKAQIRQHPHSYGIVRYFSECSTNTCERRMLFAQTFPFLLPVLARTSWFLHKERKAPEVVQTIFSGFAREWLSVIDTGGKFAQKAAQDLAESLGVPVLPALVKRVAGLSAELTTDQNILLVFANLKQLAMIPFHYIPVGGQEFINFTNGVAKCLPLLEVVGQDMDVVVKHSGKNLSRDMAKIGEQSNAPNHLKDYIESVLGKIVLAWVARRATEEGKELDATLVQSCSELYVNSLLQKAVRSRSALRLIEASERWHKGGHQHNFINRNQTFRHLTEGSTDWPPITEPVKAPNGYKLVPLVSHIDLREEGSILDHCVGGYGWQCVTGNRHIISVQDKDGRHISTLQIKDTIPQHGDVKFEKGLMSNVQHQAYHNSKPPEECLEAAAWYIEKVSTGKIDINLEAMREARAEIEKAKARNLISQKIGYHPEQADKAEELYGICRDFLPPNWPKPTLDGMVRALGVDESIKAYIDNIPVTLFKVPAAQRAFPEQQIGLG